MKPVNNIVTGLNNIQQIYITKLNQQLVFMNVVLFGVCCFTENAKLVPYIRSRLVPSTAYVPVELQFVIYQRFRPL